jgi:hypothetical protein
MSGYAIGKRVAMAYGPLEASEIVAAEQERT